jgi:hypothetical protein
MRLAMKRCPHVEGLIKRFTGMVVLGCIALAAGLALGLSGC